MVLSGLINAVAPAAPADEGSATDMRETRDQAIVFALDQSFGAPAPVDIGDQATARLSESLVIIPREPAADLLIAAASQWRPISRLS